MDVAIEKRSQSPRKHQLPSERLCGPCNGFFLGKRSPDGEAGTFATWESFANGETRFPHHASAKSLANALQYGCPICIELDKRIGKDQSSEVNAVQTPFLEVIPDIWEGSPGCLDLTFVLGGKRIQGITVSEVKPNYTLESHTTSVSHTGCEESLRKIRTWLTRCEESHSACHKMGTTPINYPTRLIDIGADECMEWKLLVPAKDQLPHGAYITLSHCWGKEVFINLRTTNIEDFYQGRPIVELPLTFQHAVIVARFLSVRYLWIDSLCIIQDSRRDWEQESGRMRDVYANALLNIGASASRNPYKGLFRPHPTTPLTCIDAAPVSGNPRRYICPSIWDYWGDFLRLPLLERGWVIQERFMARRMVHFAQHEVLWECQGQPLASEIFPGPDVPFEAGDKEHYMNLVFARDGGKKLSLSNYSDLWFNIVEQYSGCKLSFARDKLVALSGLARLFQDIIGDIYVAGLWKSCLVKCLLWFIPSKENIEESSEKCVGMRENQYLAPSWSWACVEAEVKYTGAKSAELDILAQVVEVEVAPLTDDPTGAVREGFLTLNAPFFTLTKSRKGQWQLGALKYVGYVIFDHVSGVRFQEGTEIRLLALARHDDGLQCLVLTPCRSKHSTIKHGQGLFDLLDGNNTAYERRGYLNLLPVNYLDENPAAYDHVLPLRKTVTLY